MKLSHLLAGVTASKMFQTMFGQMVVTHDIEIRSVHYDSRKIQPSDLFVALRGTASDGHQFLETAIERGAKVLVVERDEAIPDALCMHQGVSKVVVPDTRKALAVMAANLYGHPTRGMKLVGVTGTNGKTTTSHLLQAVLEAAGEKTGLIGTIEYRIGDRILPASHTTPESLELETLFAQMRDEGCQAVSMEVSSHALDQSRVHGLDFAAAVFTNLTQDHLDYHKTMERYFEAKKILFQGLSSESWAVTNADDPWGMRMVEGIHAPFVTYSQRSEADFRAADVDLSVAGTTFVVEERDGKVRVATPLIGRFNVANVLAAYAAGRALGVPSKVVVEGIAHLPQVRGRFERVDSPRGWTAIVDYAHTPDALENCLRTVRELKPANGRVITVFGAGGDRDRMKRPLMGAIVASYSDIIVVTSDNPRTEDPERIIDDILEGIGGHPKLTREPDRRKAIEQALGLAVRNDVVVIAGKGHEEYQIMGTVRSHFSDREVVEEYIR